MGLLEKEFERLKRITGARATGNTEGMERALTELRRAKVEAFRLALASAEELSRPPPYEAYTDREREDAGENLFYD